MTAPMPERRVTWAELFFDLVFVFAVTEVAALLHAEQTGLGLARAVVVFVPIYWTWVGATMRVNIIGAERAGTQMWLFVVAFCGLLMALAVPDAYHSRALLFAFAYWAARTVLLLTMPKHGRLHWHPYTVSVFGTGPLLVLGAALPPTPQLAVWALAAVIDLSTPTVLRSRLRGMQFAPAHLAERFGLFLLIALGESVVAVGAPAAAASSIDVDVLLAVAAAFGFTAGLWWVYFHFAADAMRYALSVAQVQLDIARHVLSYGHLMFIAAVISVGVGMREVVGHPADQLSWSVVALLFGGCAWYLATFSYTRWEMFRKISWTRLAGAGAVLVALPAAPFLPGWVALAVLALIVAALNAWEATRVRAAAAAAAAAG
jgi:low temperature requirement protein LtrA